MSLKRQVSLLLFKWEPVVLKNATDRKQSLMNLSVWIHSAVSRQFFFLQSNFYILYVHVILAFLAEEIQSAARGSRELSKSKIPTN